MSTSSMAPRSGPCRMASKSRLEDVFAIFRTQSTTTPEKRCHHRSNRDSYERRSAQMANAVISCADPQWDAVDRKAMSHDTTLQSSPQIGCGFKHGTFQRAAIALGSRLIVIEAFNFVVAHGLVFLRMDCVTCSCSVALSRCTMKLQRRNCNIATK